MRGNPVELRRAHVFPSRFIQGGQFIRNARRLPAVELDIREIKLRIPDNLGDGLIRPAGDLTITHRHGEKGELVRLVLKVRADPLREKQTVIYTFAASASAKISFHPGDEFFADLAVRQGDREMKFTWSSTRTASYKFERLAREPRLHEPAQKSVEGIVAEGVTATVSEGKFPSVPPLIPLVRFNNP